MSRFDDRHGNSQDKANLKGIGDSPRMGSMASRPLTPAQMHRYQETTGLSVEQLEQLNTRFRALDRYQHGYLTPTDLMRIPQLMQNPLHRLIVDSFFPTLDPNARMNFAQFVETCATLMVPQYGGGGAPSRNTRAQKLRLLSKMFDTRRIGKIHRGDFRIIMRCLLDPKDTASQSQQDMPKQDKQDTTETTKETPKEPKNQQDLMDYLQNSKIKIEWLFDPIEKEMKREEDSKDPSKDIRPTAPVSTIWEQIADSEIEAELTLLEQQAFGSQSCAEITCQVFEERLNCADIDGHLSISKWLAEENDDLLGDRILNGSLGHNPNDLPPGNTDNQNNDNDKSLIYQFFTSLVELLH
ncbi:uncharacterized protein [Drosophila bipectinata]|uniref:uncharacterized protein n=1 Tax=Drosophila bipectinata TaxID=42026 RepID=UPI001C8A92F4|nr:uncharacterized protein LOC108134067 [Drosophila bipectinata]